MTKLRQYQQKLLNDINDAHAAGHRAVMAQSCTGSGKTTVMGAHAAQHLANPWNPSLPGGVSIAHRAVLIGQMSQQLAREGVSHGLIASDAVIRGIVAAHVEEFGRTYYNARSPWKVASVDTITKRDLGTWAATVGVVHIDEAHHVLRENKWGKAAALFPDKSRLLLPTATPTRADRKGLGSHAHGLADVMVEAPPMRWFIDNGYLTDYKVFCIQPSDLSLDGVNISAGGDFNPEQLREAVHKSKRIVGDVVDTYLKHARGRLGVTFAVDVEDANRIADAFNRAGVPAAVITGENSEDTRRAILRRFARREILQLCSVDIFGEGFDLPAIECVSFARPTASFGLYTQMWGRALRLMLAKHYLADLDSYTPQQRLQLIARSSKPFAFIFDHVGNFYLHKGPPDRARVWTLDAGSKRGPSVSDGIPMRVCLNVTCAFPYERVYSCCPYCGTAAPPPAERGGPAQVDGDIMEIDPKLLAQYRGEIAQIASGIPHGAPTYIVKNHMMRQSAQHLLRETLALWYAQTAKPGDDNRTNFKRFWFTFGVDSMYVMTLGRSEADSMRDRIVAELTNRGIIVPSHLTVTNDEQEFV